MTLKIGCLATAWAEPHKLIFLNQQARFITVVSYGRKLFTALAKKTRLVLKIIMREGRYKTILFTFSAPLGVTGTSTKRYEYSELQGCHVRDIIQKGVCSNLPNLTKFTQAKPNLN